MNRASFQTEVNRGMPFGQPGDLYSSAPIVVAAYLASEDMTPGKAAFNVDGGTTESTTPKAVASTGTTATQFCGIVTRMTTGTINDIRNGYENIVNAGREVQVLSQGEVLVVLNSLPNVGDSVHVLPDGTLDCIAGTGSLETKFAVVEVVDAASNFVAISSWRKA